MERNGSDCGQELGGGTPGRSASNGWGTAARKRGYSKNRNDASILADQKTASKMVESRWLEASRKVSNRGRRLRVWGDERMAGCRTSVVTEIAW